MRDAGSAGWKFLGQDGQQTRHVSQKAALTLWPTLGKVLCANVDGDQSATVPIIYTKELKAIEVRAGARVTDIRDRGELSIMN
jgi:hypothetical protein